MGVEMKVNTNFFGEIEIADEKVITFENGIIGFPELKRFALLHDEEKGTNVGIRFLQSLDEPGFAMPVMDPLLVKPDYDPEVNDELLLSAGNVTADNILVLVTATIPGDLTKMSVNLQGPFIINVEEHKACQVIVENGNYPVKFPIYEILQSRKAGE
ncbi:MAG: flagellar assembly protein FliW [bacterium]|nr:flagellar assembly protein FliW [bacterium]